MKMKKFFSNRTKKKKTVTSIDSKESDDIVQPHNDDLPNEGRKKQLQQHQPKKNKGKRGKHNHGEQQLVISNTSLSNGGGNIPVASNGVKLRRPSRTVNSDENSHLRSPERVGDTNTVDDSRLPGSESSSRTASSASTSSHGRWSTRRPWSLVDSFVGQPIEEFSESCNDVHLHGSNNDLNRHNVTAPAICTLPRGTDPSLLERNGGRRPRTLAMDFSIFRFFRRNSSSSKSPDGETDSMTSLVSNSRGSFRLKGRKGKKSKRKSDSHSKSSLKSQKSSTSLNSDQEEKGRSKPIIEDETSASTLKAFEVYDKIEEEDRTPIHQYSSRYDSQSTQEQSSLRSSIMTGSISSDCSHCNRLRNSQGSRPSSDVQLSIIDTDPISPVTTIIRTRAPSSRNRPFSTPCSTASYLSTSTFAEIDSRDLNDASTNSTSDSSTIGASAIFGGSMNDVSHPDTRVSVSAQTLPRNVGHREQSFQARLTKTPVHSSLPHLCSPDLLRPNSCNNYQSNQFRDVSGGFARPRSATALAISKSNTALVDSPIKRAIGYPGVVLRRQQKNRTKKFGGKSASADLLTGERRMKQVMSLNMEDLPTYGEMRGDELRWRSSSLFTKSSHNSDIPQAELAGRARLRAALLYQRYSSHCTSMDDVRLALGSQQSFKDMFNLDDDEFLDMYLASSENMPASDTSRSNSNQEPSSKRVKTLRKSVASFANLISPGKPGSKKIQRSSSFKESSTPAFKPYRPPGTAPAAGEQGSGNTPGKRSNSGNSKNRRSRLWCETFDHAGLNEVELKRQEAIHELYQGECDLVQDLRLAKQTYRDSMVTLKMLTEGEVSRIFGKLECLLPLHEDLLAKLERGRSEDGRTEEIGQVFIDWFPTLSPYEEYCSNQADAKETLDAVIGREARVRDFLQRCLASPFSRKLDLWSYLDLPRSKLVKYPLLLKNILKSTPESHPDQERLEEALTIINETIGRVDDLTGERQSRFFQSKLEFLDDKQRIPHVAQSRFLLCSGQLKSNRGTKLHVFLFDLSLVLTRNATRGGKLTYQVYRQPIPVESLSIDGEEGGKLSGSFRGGILSSDKAKHSFRVRSEEMNVTYTLIATDEHDRKQWMNSLQEAIVKCQSNKRASAGSEASDPGRHSSRSSSSKSHDAKVKRSSSTKSDENRWRMRSLTSSSASKNSIKEKKNLASEGKPKKVNAESPLPRRRSNTVMATNNPANENPPPEVQIAPASVKLRTKGVVKKNNPCRRSRSLTSSPITFLPSFPKKSTKFGGGLSRSESCSTKPPTGKNHLYVLRSNKDTQSNLETGAIHETKSSPDLSALSSRSHEIHSDIPEVAARLEEEGEIESQFSDRAFNLAIDANRRHLLPSLLIESPEHPAASNTSRNFPIAEEESISPLYKPITTASPLRPSRSAPTMSFSCSQVIQPSIAWAPPAEHSLSTDPSTGRVPESRSVDDISNVVDGVLDQVCSTEVSSLPGLLSDVGHITVADDDGNPWRGDDLEMTV